MALPRKPRLLARAWLISAVAATLALIIAYGLDSVRGASAPSPSVREFVIPTTNGFPHDPAVARDGRVYFTEINANKIGRLDPASGRCDEFVVPSADSGPHGIVAGDDGWVTFTENRAGKIGRFDPRHEQFHEYATAGAEDPHTPVLAPDGAIFFTAQQANVIGRLEPSSGAVTIFAVPTPHAMPYGIKLGPDGALYFCEFGSEKIGRFDRASHRFEEFTTPTPSSAPRRLWFRQSDLYFTEYAAGRLARLRIGDRSFKEWPSPGGAGSKPYGIAIDGHGAVWYEESARGALVRFDPQAESFTTALALPTPGAVVRNMDVAPDGRVWMALSGVDRLGVILE